MRHPHMQRCWSCPGMQRCILITIGALLTGILVLLCVPEDTDAALPANELWREGLLNYRVGYGRNATGGAGGSLCTVTNLNDSGAGSLRTCLTTPGPQWIIFSVSGTIQLLTPLGANPPTGNNKTVDGRGANITIVGPTSSEVPALYISGEYNHIWHNVSFRTGNGYIVRILCGVRVWFDHIDIAGGGSNHTAFGIGSDGGTCPNSVTGTTISTEITLSYFKMHDRCYLGAFPSPLCGSGFVLIGQSDTEPLMANARLTMHHNWYQHSASTRFPNVRLARAHVFNNYMDNTDQGGDIFTHGQLVSENDIFDCSSPVGDGLDCGNSGNPERFKCNYTNALTPIPSDNCKISNPWRVAGTEVLIEQNPGTAFNPALDYSYTLETADAALRSKITDPTTGAGRVDNPYGTMSATLIVQLRMNDGTGNTVTDSSGNALHGERCEGATCPAAGPTWQTSRLLFDGVNDGVRVAAHALFGFTGDLTVGMRVNFDNLSTGNGLAAKAAAGQSPYDWVFWLETNILCFAFGGSTPGLLCSTGTLTDLIGEHLVVVTRSGTTVEFWIDGVSAGSGTMTGTMSNNSVPVWFGNDQYSYLLGTMRDARVYSGALTAGEVAAWAAEGTLAAPTTLRLVRP